MKEASSWLIRRRVLRKDFLLVRTVIVVIAAAIGSSTNVSVDFNFNFVRGYAFLDERARIGKTTIKAATHRPKTKTKQIPNELEPMIPQPELTAVEEFLPTNRIISQQQQQQQQQQHSPSQNLYQMKVVDNVGGTVTRSETDSKPQCPFHQLHQHFRQPTPTPLATGASTSSSEPTTTTTTTTATTKLATLETSPLPFSPLEAWCLNTLDEWYSRSQSLKCPFFRRRSADLLDVIESVVRKVVIRSNHHPLLGPPQAFRPVRPAAPSKKIGLSTKEIYEILLGDWKATSTVINSSNSNNNNNNINKGYYLTGRLTTVVYRDDCLFLGPDPDLPLRGLRKYMGVASHLFEYHTSTATLLSLDVVPDEPHAKNKSTPTTTTTTTAAKLIAEWQLEAVLRLPWKPHLPKLLGQTIYHIDSDGLIWCHEEHWYDCSAPKAFCATFLPSIATLFWPDDKGIRQEQQQSLVI